MAYYAYHRTSTREQHLDRGINEITDFCKTRNIELVKIYTDQQTGKNFNRPNWELLRDHVLRDNEDILICTELDRLGRNKKGILKEIQLLRDRGIRLMVLELPTTLIDFSTMENSLAKMMMETINNMMIELYASMAQAEIEKKEKRQREGIQAMKERGEWDKYGRPPIKKPRDFDKAVAMWKEGKITAKQAMSMLNLKKSTFYKFVNKLEA